MPINRWILFSIGNMADDKLLSLTENLCNYILLVNIVLIEREWILFNSSYVSNCNFGN